jgi:hypothetical protein
VACEVREIFPQTYVLISPVYSPPQWHFQTYEELTVGFSYFFYYYYLVCEAIGTAATPGLLLCQPRVIVKMSVEKQMECRLAEETEVLEENLPQRLFYPS